MITEQELNKEMRRINFIYFALLFSLVIYLFVGLTIGKNTKATIGDGFTVLRTALYVISLISLLAAKPIKKFVWKKGRISTRQTGSFYNPVIQRYTRAIVISAAVLETIGVYGLVLFMLGKNPVDLYVLLAVSAVAMLQNRPKREEVTSLFETESMGGANNTELL
jgi:F0F1-type ATP synthase membrane subunit c/vacuolar-type H+-ATPase subunit K